MKRNTCDFATEPAIHNFGMLPISAARVMRKPWIDDSGHILNVTLEGGLTAVLDNLDRDVRHYLEVRPPTPRAVWPRQQEADLLYTGDWKVALRNTSR